MVRFTAASCLAAALFSLNLSSPALMLAQNVQQAAPMSQEDGMRIVIEVRKRLSSLSNYAVFD